MKLPHLKIGDLVAKLPIIQGGMGVNISLSGLASAVAKEGGIGVISSPHLAMDEPDLASNYEDANLRVLRREIRRAKELSKDQGGIVGVNCMVALTQFADLARTAIEEGADIVFSGAGLPLDLPKYLVDGAKTKLAPIVSSARAATILCKKWLARYDYLPDAFVVEGPKAGGHVGFKPDQLDDPEYDLEKLVPAVVAAVKPFEEEHGRSIPVIAAGGVWDGADICKFLKLGAAGVQMGTRFVATHECDAGPEFKQAYVDAGPEDMTIIKSPVGMPGRALKNAFTEAAAAGGKTPFKCVYKCLHTCDHTTAPYCIAMALANAKRGKLKHGFAFAGANAHRVDKIVSVAELMRSLCEEFAEACGAEPEPAGA